MGGTLEGLAEHAELTPAQIACRKSDAQTQAHWGDAVRLDSIRPLRVAHARDREVAMFAQESMTLSADHTRPYDAVAIRPSSHHTTCHSVSR